MTLDPLHRLITLSDGISPISVIFVTIPKDKSALGINLIITRHGRMIWEPITAASQSPPSDESPPQSPAANPHP